MVMDKEGRKKSWTGVGSTFVTLPRHASKSSMRLQLRLTSGKNSSSLSTWRNRFHPAPQLVAMLASTWSWRQCATFAMSFLYITAMGDRAGRRNAN